MTTRIAPLFLALCVATLGACKKQADSSPPDGDKAGEGGSGGGEQAGDAGGDAEIGEEFLSVDGFEETMQGKQGEVADCFAQAKEAKPDLSGKLSLDITVGGDGAVAGVRFDDASTIKEASITACVEEKAKGWKFAKTRDGKEMTLPYSLNLK